MRTLLLLTLVLPVYAADAAAPGERIVVPVSPYAEDFTRFTPARVTQAVELADWHLDRCGIDLEPRPLRPLRPGDITDPARLWRTDRGTELVVLLHGPGDARRYRMAGIATLREVQGRWLGEVPWSDKMLAAARLVGRDRLSLWPTPKGGTEIVGKAKLALLWAVAMGWVTLDGPTIAAGHCGVLRERFGRLAKRWRPRVRRRWWNPVASLVARGSIRQVLASDVPGLNALKLAVRASDQWFFYSLPRTWPVITTPAVGPAAAVVQVGGSVLLLSYLPAGGVEARWLHATRRPDQLRPTRRLAGCERVLAADALRRPITDDGDAGTAIVVCERAVHQLTPFARHGERRDELSRASWATLSRWGPRRSLLLRHGPSGLEVHDLRLRERPARGRPGAAARALATAHPKAPIWQGPGADPVQLGELALRGLPGGPRALGRGVEARFSPQLYRAARATEDVVRVDAAYEAHGASSKRPRGAFLVTHPGEYGPFAWTLAREGRRWLVRPVQSVRRSR